MLMKLKSLLLIAAAAAGMTAAAQEVVSTNVADFITLGNENGEAVELVKGDVATAYLVWNKAEIEKWNACQFKVKIPEGIMIDETSFKDFEAIQILNKFNKKIETWSYGCKLDEADNTLLFVMNAKTGLEAYIQAAEGVTKVPFAKFDLMIDEAAADGLTLDSADGEEGVAFWLGGYTKYLGPKAAIKVTAVNAVKADKQVAGVKYYNVAGVESDKAFDGVNIEVTTYVDGSTKAVKVVK